jgi:rod shape-determining protein MreC
VAAFGAGANRPLPGRGPSPGFRFTIYALLSLVAMYYDQRGGVLERVRYWMQAAAYPIQLAVSSPSAAWHWFEESVETRESLRAENARLRTRERDLSVLALRFDALERENAELRGLKSALPSLAERWLVGEVVSVELSSLRQRVLVNRGSNSGVFVGQAVLGKEGLLGQTLHLGPWSSEVILITDPEHGVPVQVARNGLRSIAVGTGNEGSLTLPYLPVNSDVKAGDILMTSGLGGVFPAGYPVARVAEVRRDPAQPLAQVRATPLAALDRDREVVFVWFREGHPASPRPATSVNATLDLQPVPAPPRPPAAAPTPAADAAVASPAAGAVAAPANAPAHRAPAGTRAPATAPASTEPASAAPLPTDATPGPAADATPTPATDATPAPATDAPRAPETERTQ